MQGIGAFLARTFLVLLSMLVGFALLEASARAYLRYSADELTFLRYASLRQLEDRFRAAGERASTSSETRYSPHPYLGYYPRPNYRRNGNRHNSLGYRGEEIEIPKPRGRFRIVCIGGSTTYSTGVEDYRKSYPYMLEQRLREEGYANAEVVNAGAGGWASWESLINFQTRVLDLEPDLIIVYHAMNDIHRRLVWPPEAYRGDNSGSRIANISDLFMPSVLEYSTFIRIVMLRSGLTEPHSELTSTLAREPDTYYGDDFRLQKVHDRYPSGIFEEVTAAEMLRINKPIYFKRNIENLVVLAHRWDIEAVIATFAYSPLFEDRPLVFSEEYRAAFREMNETLVEIAEETDTHLFDFAAVFPQSKEYYKDGRHVNAKGQKLKVELFARYLIENGLLPAPS